MIINKARHSKNYHLREHGQVRYLILHYTERDFETSLRLLTEGEVSSHYLISEEGGIYQLVDEKNKAFHAGKSHWKNDSGLNETSIGIEIVNGGAESGFPEFPDQQIQSVIELCQDILQRHNILPEHVLAHSDIAPDRKVDPGPKFPWKRLADAGVGVWFDENVIKSLNGDTARGMSRHFEETFSADESIHVFELQKNLALYGYHIQPTGILDDQTRCVLQAFQLHFRPRDYSGVADLETAGILGALIKEYYPA